MRRVIVGGIGILLCFVCQTALFGLLKLADTAPNIMLILVASIAVMRGQKEGMIVGFFSGLLYDLFYGSVFGFTALCFLYAGFASGFLFKVFFDEDIRVPMATVGICELIYKLLSFPVEYAVGRQYRFRSYLVGSVIPAVIASILFTIALYYLYRLINRRIVAQETETRQSPWLR